MSFPIKYLISSGIKYKGNEFFSTHKYFSFSCKFDPFSFTLDRVDLKVAGSFLGEGFCSEGDKGSLGSGSNILAEGGGWDGLAKDFGTLQEDADGLAKDSTNLKEEISLRISTLGTFFIFPRTVRPARLGEWSFSTKL